jgi:hypothetical protein
MLQLVRHKVDGDIRLTNRILHGQRQLQPAGRPALTQVGTFRKVRLRLPQIGRHHVFQHNVKTRTGARQSKTAARRSGPNNSDPANLKRRLDRSRLLHFLLATAVITDS